MKTIFLSTIAAFAATALAAQEAATDFEDTQPRPVFYGCETVDQGGYLTFADPTCPAAVTTATADYDPVTGAPLDNK